MIDLISYRARIGMYTPGRKIGKPHDSSGTNGVIFTSHYENNISTLLIYIFYLFILIYVAAVSMSFTVMTNIGYQTFSFDHMSISDSANFLMPPMAITYTKVLSVLLVMFIIKRSTQSPNSAKFAFLSVPCSQHCDNKNIHLKTLLHCILESRYVSVHCHEHDILVTIVKFFAHCNYKSWPAKPRTEHIDRCFSKCSGPFTFWSIERRAPYLRHN